MEAANQSVEQKRGLFVSIPNGTDWYVIGPLLQIINRWSNEKWLIIVLIDVMSKFTLCSLR